MYNNLTKNKNFICMALGGFISGIGDYMYNLAITVSLYSMTKSVGAVAMMWIARGILRIPVQYLAGVISDKYNKKRIITTTNFISIFVALSFIMAKGKFMWIAYVSAFLLQSLNDLDENAEVALLPNIVSKEDLPKANSTFSFLQSISMFLAPALAALIYKVWGSNILYTINAMSFLLATGSFVMIKYEHIKNSSEENDNGMIKSGIEGYEILRNHKPVQMLFLISGIFAILGRFYETYKVAIADVMLNMGGEGIAYFEYAIAIGGLFIPIIVKFIDRFHEIRVYVISSIFVSVGFCIFGYSKNVAITLITMSFMGIALNLQGMYSRIIIQKNIEKEYMGRIFSFYKIIITAFALVGLIVAEPLYRLTSIGNTFFVTGIIATSMCILYGNCRSHHGKC